MNRLRITSSAGQLFLDPVLKRLDVVSCDSLDPLHLIQCSGWKLATVREQSSATVAGESCQSR